MFERTPEPEIMLAQEECEFYNQELVDDPKVLTEFVETYNRYVKITTGLIIDLGAGPCQFTIALCKVYPNLSVTCYEASSEMIKIARRNITEAGLENQITLIQDNFFNATGKFDVVIANRVLHHINDTKSFWSLVNRLSNNVLVCDLGRPATLDFLKFPLPVDAINSFKAAYTLDEVLDQIKDYNYSIVKEEMNLDLYRFTIFTKIDS